MDGCAPGGAVTDECSREYTFAGSAYIGACEDCTFQMLIDTSAYTASPGDYSCRAVSLPFGEAGDDWMDWPTLVHRPSITTYEEYGHGPGGTVWVPVDTYTNAVAIRTITSIWGWYTYDYDIVAHGSDVIIEDGVVTFSGTRTFYTDWVYYGREIHTDATLRIDYTIPDDVTEDGFFWAGPEDGFYGAP